ncbi:hypothetical protein F5Y02DRAFT_166330 [Annulohypoxylon stygium]|nr:hypothetical protein F5Y02DRAFT_166330 [Annulohypoxylon stygium]
MDKLPPEILLRILSHLGEEKLAPYTTVCRGFQKWLETRTFAHIVKKIRHRAQVEEFDAIFANPRRHYLPQSIKFKIWLPAYMIPRKRTKDGRRLPLGIRRNKHFTRIVRGIFESLHKWNAARGLSDKPFFLTFNGVPRDDHNYRHMLYGHKHVGFHNHQVLPELPFVTHIRFEQIDILPSAMSTICKAVPRIENMIWEITYPPFAYDALRLSLREALASTLLETDFSHLQHLWIRLNDKEPLNDDFRPENYAGVDGSDRLSLAVNRILKLPKLTTLLLHGVFILSPEIFDVDDECESISRSLREFHLHLSRRTPDRQWYFTGNRGEDADNQLPMTPNYYRNRPAPNTFNPFVNALGRAVTKMPALEILNIQFIDEAYITCFAGGDFELINTSLDDSTVWSFGFRGRQQPIGEIISRLPRQAFPLPPEFLRTITAAGHSASVE